MKLRSAVEILRSIRVGKGEIVCPVCGSKRLRRATALSGWLTGWRYYCEDCGYTGPIYKVEENLTVLCLADPHGRWKKLLEAIERVDSNMVLIAGDLLMDLEGVLEKADIEGRAVFYVPGNMDSPREAEIEGYGSARNLHNRKVVFNGFSLGGFGGANKGPFHTPFEWREEEALEKLRSLGGVDILLTHAPPKNTNCDRGPFGMHIGSIAVRKYIEEFQPKLVVCGHIHESRGIDKIGETVIVNPGPLHRGYAAIARVTREVIVDLIEI